MALTLSNMLALQTVAPYFKLLDANTNTFFSLSELQGKQATIILFICNHCPYVIYIKDELVRLFKDYAEKEISFIAINSNDTQKYPADNFENMKLENYPFPYLLDETQAVAKLYGAACTPDIFIFDKNLKLSYRGQLDDARPGNGKICDGKDVRDAINKILTGEIPSPFQKPSVGCNIKWK